LKELWKKLPTWLRALLIGVILFYPAITILQLLLFQNLANYSSTPWSFPIVIILLWLYWRFTTGADKPFKASAKRVDLSMSSLYTKGNMTWILLAIFGLVFFTYSLIAVGYAFVKEDTDQFELIMMFTKVPVQTGIFLILALALTAGIVEEVVFRGYVQTMLERSYGALIAFALPV